LKEEKEELQTKLDTNIKVIKIIKNIINKTLTTINQLQEGTNA